MPTEMRSTTPRARKQHVCEYCVDVIPVGAVYHRTTLIFDGRIYDWIACCPCDQLVNTVWQWTDGVHDEGIGRVEFLSWAEEHRNDTTHGEAARAFFARAVGVSGDGDTP